MDLEYEEQTESKIHQLNERLFLKGLIAIADRAGTFPEHFGRVHRYIWAAVGYFYSGHAAYPLQCSGCDRSYDHEPIDRLFKGEVSDLNWYHGPRCLLVCRTCIICVQTFAQWEDWAAHLNSHLVPKTLHEEDTKWRENTRKDWDSFENENAGPGLSKLGKRANPGGPRARLTAKKVKRSGCQPTTAPVQTVASFEPVSPKITTVTELSQTASSTVVSLRPTVPEETITVITYDWEREDVCVAVVEELEDGQDIQRLTALEAIRRIAPERGVMQREKNAVGVRRPIHTTLMALMRHEEYLKLVGHVHAFRAMYGVRAVGKTS